jgi:co-chaperonin GroES (HSP10)
VPTELRLANSFPALADFDGDKKLDAVYATINNAYVLHGNGDGTFATTTLKLPLPSFDGETIVSPITPTTGDFDDDGKQDFALLFQLEPTGSTTPNNSALVVFYGDGAGGFTQGSPQTYSRLYVDALGVDLDGDNHTDLLLTSTNSNNPNAVIGTVHGSSKRTLGAEANYVAGVGIANVVARDVNKDGALDIVVTNGNTSMPAPDVITVLLNLGNPPIVTGKLVASPEPSTANQPFTITATLTPPVTATLQGSVSFTIDGAAAGQAAVTNNAATITVSTPLTVGDHALVATWTGDPTYPGVNLTATHTVIGLSTTTTVLTSSKTPSMVGESVTFTAQVNGLLTQAPSGSVTFRDGATVLGVVTTPTSSATTTTGSTTTYTIASSTLTAGTHTITATYSGDTANTGSMGSPLTQVVQSADALMTLVAQPSSIYAGQSTTLTAAVHNPTGSTAAVPTGNVVFTDGAVTLGTSALDATGAATLPAVLNTVATHTITATYAGDTLHNGASANAVVQVQQLTTALLLVSQLSPSPVGAPVTFNVTLSTSQTTALSLNQPITLTETGKVLASGTLAANGSGSFIVSSLAVGQHSIVANFAGTDTMLPATSNTVVQIVAAADAPMTLVAQPASIYAGQSTTLTATVHNPTGSTAAVPTGNVVFTDGAVTLGTIPLDATGLATLHPVLNTVAQHTITATYAGDPSHNGSNANAVVQVQQLSTALLLVPQLSPSAAATPVTFSVSLSTSQTTALPLSQPITLTETGKVLASGTLAANGSGSIVVTGLAIGNHTIVANFAGTDTMQAATSSPAIQVVAAADAPMTLVAQPAIIYAGQSTALTAIVHNPTGSTIAVPTGNVVFTDGTVTLGTAPLDATGLATLHPVLNTVGQHTITATYAGDPLHSGANATALVQVQQLTTALLLASPLSPSAPAAPVTFNVSLSTSQTTALPLNQAITLTEGGKVLASGTLAANGSGSIVVTGLAIGNHTIVANFAGTDTMQAATSNPVTQVVAAVDAPMTLVAQPSSIYAGQSTTLTATVHNPAGSTTAVPTGNVVFTDGAVTLGTSALDATGAATLPAVLNTVATHTITATYAGDPLHSGANANAVVQVQQLTTALLLASPVNPSAAGAAVTFNVTLSTPQTTALPLNQPVTLTEAGKVLASGTLAANGSGSLVVSGLAIGNHTIVANFAGTASMQPAISTPFIQVVAGQSVSVTLTASPNPAYLTQTVTLTAAVTTNSTQAPPTGSVSFMEGNTVLGSVPVTNGKAVFTISTLSAADHTIISTYSGDGNYAGTSSAPVTVTILPSNLVLTSSSTSLTVQTQHHLFFTLQATSIGSFADTLSFSAAGLPEHATIQFTPSFGHLGAGATLTTNVYLETSDVPYYESMATPGDARTRVVAAFAGLGAIPLVLLLATRKRRIAGALLLALLAIVSVGMSGCSGKYPASVAPGQYTLHLVATGQNTGQTRTLDIPWTVTP